jgi:hypothetical protein
MDRPSTAEIAHRQDDDRNLRRQLAARRYYSLAKGVRFLGQSVSTGLALTSPLVLWLQPDLGPKLAAIAGLWIFVSRFLVVRLQRSLVEKGAVAQEVFDCTVFGLDWNPVLAREPAQEDIRRASERSLGRIDRVKAWYPCTAAADWPLSVLVCQRSNAVWARRQHTYYGFALCGAVAVWIVFGVGVAAAESASLVEYLTIIALPSLPALLDWAELAEGHLEAATKRGDLEQQIGGLVREGDAHEADLREIQDGLFDLRRSGQLVPDWFYKLIRKSFERDMQGAASDYISEADASD